MAKAKKEKSNTIVQNRKARFEYEIMDKYEAGIALAGTEVKSIKAGKVKITEAFCEISDDMQLYLKQMEVATYDFGNRFNHHPTRDRKLLMNKKEIIRIYSTLKEKGLTLIPLSLYKKKGIIKVQIAVCRGKKLHDKRQSMKERDAKREINRALKNM